VAAWVKELREEHSTPGVKQQLAAVRMLFDWLITGQVMPTNPAASVRGPIYVVATGKTPVLDGREWRKLIDANPADTVRDLRDRALNTQTRARPGFTTGGEIGSSRSKWRESGYDKNILVLAKRSPR
jgi:hypothetical protein